MFALAVLTIIIIIRSNRRFRSKNVDESGETVFNAIINSKDNTDTWPMVELYVIGNQRKFMDVADEAYRVTTQGFCQGGSLGLSTRPKGYFRKQSQF